MCNLTFPLSSFLFYYLAILGDGNESKLCWIAVRSSLNYLGKLKERSTEERKTLEFANNIRIKIENRLPTEYFLTQFSHALA